MADLTTLPNIGSEMARKLSAVGIDCAETLAEVGEKAAFLRLKEKYPQVCLVHLYALAGAAHGTQIDCLSEATKADLKAFSDSLKERAYDSADCGRDTHGKDGSCTETAGKICVSLPVH